MDFNLDSETVALVARYRDFVDERLIPLEPELLEQGLEPLLGRVKELRAEARAAGLWGPSFPKEYGGQGLDLVTHGLVSEALGRCPLGHYVFGCNAPDAGNLELLHMFGSDEQKKRWLAPLAKGDIRTCFGMTEADNSGANPLMLSTRARLDGDEWVLDGRKWFTTGADGAALCIVMAVTEPDAPPHKRASMILVPTDTPGYRMRRNTPVMGHAGRDLFSHGEIEFEDCRVPSSSLLGPRGEGFRLAQARLGPGRIHHCMRWLGICERALELMISRSLARRISPDGARLSDSDIIRAWIAESAAEIRAARLMVLHAAWRIEHAGARAARDDVSIIKFYVAEVLQRVLDRALQVHGGLGMTDYTVLAWYYREGEGLDVAALEAFLADGIPGFRGPLTVRQFAAGFSNLTYLLEAGSCEWVLRRPPRGTKPSSGHDMVREYRVLSGLQGRYPFAPAPVLLCEDSSVIGAPFYLAERLSGIILRRDYPPTIEATPTLVRAQQEALLDALAQLHAVDFECAGLGDLGQPAGYVQRQVSGWARRYERARTDDAPDATDLVAWLEHNRPPDTDRVALIHNDFKLDNVVFDRAQPARLTGVLDWEMATLGDPRMDLGCSLAYWVQADDPDWFVATRMLPTHLPGSLTRREAIERYEASAGRELRDMGFFYAFGVFRLSVIAQQIYLRYALGETKDPRFAVLGDMVRALLRGAGEAATGRLARA